MIRQASLKDAASIQQLISFHAEKGEMLFRMLEDIRDEIDNFLIYEKNGEIIGTCALNRAWGKFIEVRSLAVDPRHFGQGVATGLVNECVRAAQETPGSETLFVLTYAVKLFEKLGFNVVRKDTLPWKVWSDCQGCTKRDDCDEIAMVRCLHPVKKSEAEVPPIKSDKKIGLGVS